MKVQTLPEYAAEIGSAVKKIEDITGKSIKHFRVNPMIRAPENTLRHTVTPDAANLCFTLLTKKIMRYNAPHVSYIGISDGWRRNWHVQSRLGAAC